MALNPITYADLLEKLQELTVKQLEQTLTVELGLTDEYLPADFRICDSEHDVLDENHPVIYTEY